MTTTTPAHDTAAADWLWIAGAPNYVALAFGDYVARTNWATRSYALSNFWYDPLGLELRGMRGKEPDTLYHLEGVTQ